ncbi:MAG: hypothetical protein K1565_01870 [Candidatus Thiodiazotropha sp. (ex. Lucinisca nassula)]|nr:hypothetical protein [Candidatus Thiodiazotropha sp. (ex. Lucinisca nassula)]
MMTAGGCVATTKAEKTYAEPLHDFRLTDTSLWFTVTSNGCTQLEHFDIVMQHADIPQLTVVRKKQDNCRRKRRALDIEYPLSMVGIDATTAFTIGNPFIPFRKQIFK